MPVSSNESVFLQSLRVALDRKNRDFSRSTTQNLISYGFRTRKRRLKLDRLPVLLFPFGGETGKDRLFQRLFHDRETVKRNRHVAAFARWRRQTTHGKQRHDERSGCKKRNALGRSLPHEGVGPPIRLDRPKSRCRFTFANGGCS